MSADSSNGAAAHGKPSRTDGELVVAARRGDSQAFDELVDRHAHRLFRLAFRLVSRSADAEDVVQETLMGAFRHLGRFRERSTVKTWLSSILVRQAARCLRKRGRRKVLPLHEAASEVGDRLAGRTGAGPSEQVTRSLDVRQALQALSREHREVVVLREYEGMSYAEISEVLGVPRGTVESRLFRARQHLKVELRGYLP